MIINGVDSMTYNARLMEFAIGLHNSSDFYNIVLHDEYLLRGRPSHAPCSLWFMVQGDDQFALQINISKLKAALDKSIFELPMLNNKVLTCYAVYNSFEMDKEFVDFMTGKYTCRIKFDMEVFRKVGVKDKASSPNNGTAPAKPIITVNVLSSIETINIDINGKRKISLVGGFVSGDTIVIDLVQLKVTKNGLLSLDSVSINTILSNVFIQPGEFTIGGVGAGSTFDISYTYDEVYQ